MKPLSAFFCIVLFFGGAIVGNIDPLIDRVPFIVVFAGTMAVEAWAVVVLRRMVCPKENGFIAINTIRELSAKTATKDVMTDGLSVRTASNTMTK